MCRTTWQVLPQHVRGWEGIMDFSAVPPCRQTPKSHCIPLPSRCSLFLQEKSGWRLWRYQTEWYSSQTLANNRYTKNGFCGERNDLENPSCLLHPHLLSFTSVFGPWTGYLCFALSWSLRCPPNSMPSKIYLVLIGILFRGLYVCADYLTKSGESPHTHTIT